MEPYTYNQVSRDYDEFRRGRPDVNISLPQFAKLLDQAQGAQLRTSAYNDNFVKRLNAGIETAIDETGLPAVGEYAGRSLSELIDAPENIQRILTETGRATPRMAAEGLLTLVSPGSQLPRAAAYGARALGYGSAAARGYSETDSVLGGAIAPASIAAANYVLPLVGNRALTATQNWLNRTIPETILPAATSAGKATGELLKDVRIPELAQRGPMIAGAVKVGAELGAGTILNEATRQGMLTAQGVPLTDSARNPFTTENVVANVAGLAPFAPQFVHSTLKAPKVNIAAVDRLNSWLADRETFLKTQTWEQTPGGKKAPEPDPELQRSGMLPTMLRNAAGNYEQAMAEGQPEWAGFARNQLKRLLFSARPKDFEGMKQTAEELSSIARMAAPDTPEGWDTFISEYNAIVDQYWKNLYDPNVKKSDKNIGQIWHPAARNPQAIKQLQEGGYLPKITPEYLAEQYNFFFDRALGDPRVASKAVAQKLVNDLMSRLDDAVATREKAEQVDVQPGQRRQVKQEAELRSEETYLDSLMKLPKEVRERLFDRHIEMQENIDSGKGDFQTGGTPHSYYSGWRDLIIQAAETYDPTSATFTYMRPERTADPKTGAKRYVRDAKGEIVYKPERRLLSDLFAKNVDRSKGKYVLYPEAKAIRPMEGGKLRGETSLDAPRNEGQTGYDVTGGDEAQFWTDLGEGKYRPGEFNTVTDLETGEKLGTSSEYTDPLAEPGITQPTAEEAGRMQIIGEQVKDKLGSMTDKELWTLVSPLYVQTSKSGLPIASSTNSFRSRHFKLALQALGEEGWLNTTGGKAAQDRPLGKAGRELLELMKARGMVKTVEGQTERKALLDGLNTFFRRGNTGSLQEQLLQVMQKIVEPGDLEVLRKGLLGRGNTEAMADKYATRDATSMLDEKSVMPGNRPGFGQDYYTTMKWMINKRFGQLGYTGPMRDLLTEVASAVAAKGDKRSATFYNLADNTGAVGLAQPVAETTAIGVDLRRTTQPLQTPEAVTAWVTDAVRTTLHELSHINDFIRRGWVSDSDVYTQQQKQLLDGMYILAQKLSPEERDAILTTTKLALYPQELRGQLETTEVGSDKMYGANTPNEFVAQMNSMVETALLMGKKGQKRTAEDVFEYLPAEVTQYMRGQFRAVADVLDAARTALLSDQTAPDLHKPSKVSAEALDSVVQTARSLSEFRKLDEARSAGRQLAANLDAGMAGALQMPTAPVWKTAWKGMPFVEPARMPAMEQTINDVRKQILVVDPTEKGAKPGFFQKFYPFYNLMHSMERSGVPLAKDVWNLATSITPAIHRVESAILEPFLTRNAQGRFEFDGNNALIAKIAKEPTGKWRTALNSVRRWQNEHDFKPVFVKEPNGVITVTKDGKPLWDEMVKRLSPEDAQAVMNGSVALDQSYQKASGLLVGSMFESINNRVAATLMSYNRGMNYEQAKDLSSKVLAGYLSGDTAQLGALPPNQLQMLGRLLVGQDGLLAKFEEVKKHLEGRPGFSSEQLPHDWIIQYKNKDGETKFISAETEKKAVALAQKLQGEGATITSEIFNKKTATKYHEFDAPDEILTKFVDVENAAWEKFLATLPEQEAQGLRESYAPGEVTTKELNKQGLRKFMLENEGKVDTKKLDYLEAYESYVSRLSASIAFRSVRQQLNLILNDPRSKPYKTFKQQVADHFDFIFSPTPKSLSEWKSMLSGYYMGANLSSAFIEGTQSLVTLVPTLINLGKGSIGQAYKHLWDGVADMTSFTSKDWQTRARRAKLNEGSLSPEDERILMYERAVQDGLIDHGVIQDLNFGRDQRLLLASKFGRGDLSDVSLGEMVKDKAYIGSQMMMRLYSWAALANNKVSFLAGVRQGQNMGLKGDALYKYARQVKDLSTFGGGKSNMPTYVSQWSSPYTRNAFVMMHTLQQYGMGMFATYSQLAKDSIGSSLPPGQRLQARKALGTMLLTQTAIAGALGLPFAAAALTMLEKTFGIEANKAVREGLASLAGKDEDGNITPAGAMLADLVLNGAGNQLFGLDVSSRAGVSTLFGTSAYKGFNIGDMLGPVPGILENVYNSLGQFGQGEPVKAAKSLVPQAFKNAIEMADIHQKYGDFGFRDKSGNLLYQPSQGQLAAYMIGFRPRELSAKRQAQTMMSLSEDNATRARAQKLDKAAQGLMTGNPQIVQEVVSDFLATDPLLSREDIMRQIITRVADAQIEKDITTSGLRGNDENRLDIARVAGPDVVGQRSELDRTILMMQAASQLGQPGLVKPDALGRAAMIDALTENRRMSRGQAVQLLQFVGQ